MLQDLVAGDTLNFLTSTPGYSASDGWVLKYRLVPRGAGAEIAITAAAEGADHRVQVAAATSATWAAGPYGWTAWVELTGQSYTVGAGQITIRPDLRTLAAGADTRSAAEQGLAAITALILGKATTGQLSYSIAGRQLQSYSLAELLRLEVKYKREVDAERAAAGLPPLHNSGIRPILCRLR